RAGGRSPSPARVARDQRQGPARLPLAAPDRFYICAGSRTRTDTPSREGAFETPESTISPSRHAPPRTAEPADHMPEPEAEPAPGSAAPDAEPEPMPP